LREEATDLSFADFDGTTRLYPAPGELAESAKQRNRAAPTKNGLTQ
jgi:hypothetical protein